MSHQRIDGGFCRCSECRAAAPTSQPAAAASPAGWLLPIGAVGSIDAMSQADLVLDGVVLGSIEGILFEDVRFTVLATVGIVLDRALGGDEAAQLCVDEMRAAIEKYCAQR